MKFIRILLVFIIIFSNIVVFPNNKLAPLSVSGREKSTIGDSNLDEVTNKRRPGISKTRREKRKRTIRSKKRKSRQELVQEMTRKISSMHSRVHETFESLTGKKYIREDQKGRFLSYKPTLFKLLEAINRKIEKKLKRGERGINFLRHPGFTGKPGSPVKDDGDEKVLNICYFFGTFAPFHLGHLITCLRYMANPETTSDYVLVTPNMDSENQIVEDRTKPHKPFFLFRKRWTVPQIKDVNPMIRFCEAGKTRNVLEIISKSIRDHPGYKQNITQLLGDDVMNRPSFLKALKSDYENWMQAAETNDVTFTYSLYVVEREGIEVLKEKMSKLMEGEIYTLTEEDKIELGIPVEIDVKYEKGAVSGASSDFAKGREVAIFYPSQSVLNSFIVFLLFDTFGLHAGLRDIVDKLNKFIDHENFKALKEIMNRLTSKEVLDSKHFSNITDIIKIFCDFVDDIQQSEDLDEFFKDIEEIIQSLKSSDIDLENLKKLIDIVKALLTDVPKIGKVYDFLFERPDNHNSDGKGVAEAA